MLNEVDNDVFENKFGYKVAIEEMQSFLEHQYLGVRATSNTAQQVLRASSLIVALLGALQLVNVAVDPRYFFIYLFLIGLAMLFYIALIVCCVRVLNPIDVFGPTPADWDQLRDGFIIRKDDLGVLNQRLSNLLRAIPANEPVIAMRRRYVTIACFLLPFIVIILLLLSLIPRV